MTLLVAAFTIGLILALLALGMLVSFRIFAFPDLTAEGSITLGAAVATILIVHGQPPVFATVAACVAGSVAGMLTGLIHTRLKVNALLAGILMMTALYSINLHVMGRSNLPLTGHTTLIDYAASFGHWISGGAESLQVLGRDLSWHDLSSFLMVLVLVSLATGLLAWFFRTHLGTAMLATGDNPQMVRALGVDDRAMMTLGLAVSNGLVALSGALLAQYQGFVDAGMGIGMLVWGLASVIIGETLVGSRRLAHLLIAAVLGSLLFRLLVAIALRWGLDPNDLKLVTAVFVLAALVLPGALGRLRMRPAGGA